MLKRPLIIICLLTVVPLGFVAYNFFSIKETNVSFTKEKDPHLSPEEYKIFKDMLTTANESLKATRDSEEKSNWYLSQGYAYYGLGKLSLADESYEQAIKESPKKVAAYIGKFQTQVDMGNNEGALATVKKAVTLSPDNPDIWRRYLQLGIDKLGIDKPSLEALFAEAIDKTKTNPNAIDMVTFYASWLKQVGEYQASKEYWQKAILLDSNRKQIYQQEIDNLMPLLSN